MDDHRDDVDAWLHARIDPLPPPPGTFELIKRRARRRRYRQAAASAATVAAVIAAIIVVPRMATSVLHITPGQGANAASGRSAAQAPGGGGTLKTSSTPVPTPSGGSPAASAGSSSTVPPVPPDFAPTSATFVGLGTGWVIGQAGVPGQPCATQYCTSIARTDDAGQSWFGVHAPVTGAPDGSSGVSQIRFLNTSDGWAFGPELFATHDGGQRWTSIPTGGRRVTDLETVGDRAFAVFASCGGTGAGFASQCTSFSLYSTTAGNDNWAPMPGPVTGLSDGGQATSASLVLTGGRGYLLAPGGSLYAGPVDGSSAWQQAGPGPAGSAGCRTGAAQRGGQPSGEMLAAASSSDLVLACAAGSGTGGARVFTSSDSGHTWQQAGTAPGGGTVTSVAAQPGGEIVIATTAGIDTSHDGGASWQQLEQSPAGPAGGFSYAGMTNPWQGVAVPADPSGHAVWFTFDGGKSWQRSPIGNS
jgi:hypothetical protein